MKKREFSMFNWNVEEEIEGIMGRVETVFDSLAKPLPSNFTVKTRSEYRNKVNVFRLENGQYHLEVELPGVKSCDVAIEFLATKGLVRVKSTRHNKGKTVDNVLSYPLPAEATIEGVGASFADGLLTLVFPVRTEKTISIPIVTL